MRGCASAARAAVRPCPFAGGEGEQETSAGYRVVTDANGRQHRIGESPESILGRSRAWMMWLPWIAVMAVSVFEYGHGAAAGTLQSHNHWSQSQAFWLVTIWAVFQPMIAFPAGRLRESGVLPVKVAMLVAALLSAIGFVTIADTGAYALVIAGYSVIGGIGAGLVYASCINMVGKWFPEKRGARTGFVNGGFAYGTLRVSAGFVLLLRQPQTPPAAPQEAPAATREERRPLATRELATAGSGGD